MTEEYEDKFEEFISEEDEIDELAVPEEEELDELSKEFVKNLVEKIMQFMETLVGYDLHPYQKPLAKRIIESIIINDGEEVTALASRQSGKSETIANTVATLMIILPRLARMYPDLLGKFGDGIWVGMFAPIQSQVETLYSRTVSRLTSQRALEVLGDPEIDDMPTKNPGVTRNIKLKNSGSTLMMMTANPRAKIESKSFHLIIIDECQEADDFVVSKSIAPMGAYYNATIVKTGTPSTMKNNFYRAIQLNKRRQTARSAKQNHYQWDWKDVAKYNLNYEKFIRKEMLRIGEDSDEFQLSYNCKWLLERGMFITSSIMDDLGDTSQELVKNWHRSPVVVGIDPARKMDSTVVTVVWVDWDRPDGNYDVLAIGVDSNGVGDAVAQRLKVLMPRAQVISVTSSPSEQSKRWKHLQSLIQRQMVSWPAHAKTRRLRIWKKFYQQMTDAEVNYKGPNFLVSAPNEAHAHDDFVDSLALACAMTQDMVMPTVEVSSSPFF